MRRGVEANVGMAPSLQLGEKRTEPVGVFVIDGDWAHSGNHVAKGEISWSRSQASREALNSRAPRSAEGSGRVDEVSTSMTYWCAPPGPCGICHMAIHMHIVHMSSGAE